MSRAGAVAIGVGVCLFGGFLLLRRPRAEEFDAELVQVPDEPLHLPGAARNFAANLLPRLALLGLRQAWLRPSPLPRPVFATAANQAYFGPLKNSVANLRRVFPGVKVFVWDLGLSVAQAKEVTSWCGVSLRRFQASKYGSGTGEGKHYRWKPLAVAETLKEYPVVWWMDTSIFWKPRANLSLLYEGIQSERLFPIAMIEPTGTSIYAVTNPSMYEYLPISKAKAQNFSVLGANAVLFVRSPETRKILRWWVLCALDKACMAPEEAQLSCSFTKGDRYVGWGGCHRYDQSALNILLATSASKPFHHEQHYPEWARTQRGVSNPVTMELC